MIKVVDLVWTEVEKTNEYFKYYGNIVAHSQKFSFGTFYIEKNEGTNILSGFLTQSFEGYPVWISWGKPEDAKQACQDYLQQIAEEIVKC